MDLGFFDFGQPRPTAPANSRRVTSWTGWLISCPRRGSTVIGITGCSHRTTKLRLVVTALAIGNIIRRREAVTGRRAVGRHAASLPHHTQGDRLSLSRESRIPADS